MSLDCLERELLYNPATYIGNETDEICGLKHHFAPGVYARETTVPAGMAVVGHRHKHEHLNIVLKGKAIVVCEGQEPKMIEGPCVFVSGGGVRKAAIVIEDFTILNIHATEETDLEVIEAQTIEKTDDFMEMVELIEQAKALAGGEA
jgi:quercetin dioxygenase-like cupin family protein